MKSIIAILVLSSSIAQASTDYIAIGAIVNEGKAEIAKVKLLVSCLITEYAQRPTCTKIEELNKITKTILNVKSHDSFVASCGDTVIGRSAFEYNGRYINKARALAVDTPSDDPVHGVISKLEKSLVGLLSETTEAVAKAKLQETYISKCLLGEEPEPRSILDQICK